MQHFAFAREVERLDCLEVSDLLCLPSWLRGPLFALADPTGEGSRCSRQLLYLASCSSPPHATRCAQRYYHRASFLYCRWMQRGATPAAARGLSPAPLNSAGWRASMLARRNAAGLFPSPPRAFFPPDEYLLSRIFVFWPLL